MHFPDDRNDRVLLGTASVLGAVAIAATLSSFAFDPRFDVARLFANSAAADTMKEPVRPTYRNMPANGLTPMAHNVRKIVKTDDPISIVRDPTDLPPPVGARGPKRVKVELATI